MTFNFFFLLIRFLLFTKGRFTITVEILACSLATFHRQ